MNTFQFVARFVRRIPDPNFHLAHGTERHMALIHVANVPSGLPLDPNAREPNIRKRVYRDVEESLLDQGGCEPGTFHLKNKGITVIARSLRRVQDDLYEISLDDGHGIVDGGHTYEIIQRNLDNPELPREQFVKIEVLTSVPNAWIPDIAGGLNTSVQVQQRSLLDLQKAFEWIKEELKDEPYFGEIGWSENDPGAFEVRDVLSMMACFNIDLYPKTGDAHPVASYEKKSAIENMFRKDFEENDGRSFKKLRPILKDILYLYDLVRYEWPIVNNKHGGKAKSLRIVDSKDPDSSAKVKAYEFPFIGKSSYKRLNRGALFPIFAAFRWMVEENPVTGDFCWKGGFDAVLQRWEESQVGLVKLTKEKAEEVGRNPDAVGKSRPHWGAMFKEVAFVDLMKQAN